MDRPTNRTTSVGWRTEGVTAAEGEDYIGGNGQIVFGPREIEKKIRVRLLDEDRDESTETFEVVLSAPVYLTIGDARGIGTIADDDLPTVGMAAAVAAVTEGEAARFNLVRGGDLSAPLEVPVTVKQHGDFILGAVATSVTFSAGADMAVLVAPTEDDELDEEDGKIEVMLVEGASHGIAGSQTRRSWWSMTTRRPRSRSPMRPRSRAPATSPFP